MADGKFKKGMIPWNKTDGVFKTCPKCKKEFRVKPSFGRVVCCSRRCSRLGKLTSERQKQAARLIGLQSARWMKGRTSWNKGLKGFMAGEKHYLYKQDRTQLKISEKKHLDGQYRDWMFAIKIRDGWKCRIYNRDCNGRLEAHHILSWKDYPELRHEINNGITLCHAHHPKKRAEEVRLAPIFHELVMTIAN